MTFLILWKETSKDINLFENESPHSFRHGGTVDSLQKAEDLPTVMYRAYMKNVSTTRTYSKGLSVLFPNFDWNKAGVDITQVSADDLSFQMQSWRAFVDSSEIL